MIDESKIGKLTVGDIADYEQWRRERRKEELIGIVKELYGDNIPGDALTQIEQSLRKIPSITDDDGFASENIEKLEEWILSTSKDILRDESYCVKAINFTTYGATMVYTGQRSFKH